MAGHVRKLPSSIKYQARFPVGGGRYRSRNFDRKIDADRWITEQNAARDRGSWVDPRSGRTPLRDVADEWLTLRGHLADSTIERDRSYLRSLILPRFGHVPVGAITTDTVEDWIRTVDRKPATVHKAFQILCLVLDRAVRTRLIAVNPARAAEGLPRIEREEMRFLTREEVAALADACHPHETLIWFAAYTGLRWAELAGLRWKHLNLDDETATCVVADTLVEVNGSRLIAKPPKTVASRRTVTLPRPLIGMLTEGEAGVLVFGSLRKSNFGSRIWKPAVRATVGEPMRFHDLRHTQAAWLIEAGVHPKVIQARLGHASIRTTLDLYGHLMPGLDRDAADRLAEAPYRHSLTGSG